VRMPTNSTGAGMADASGVAGPRPGAA
jgi:hypothetical protein